MGLPVRINYNTQWRGSALFVDEARLEVQRVRTETVTHSDPTL